MLSVKDAHVNHTTNLAIVIGSFTNRGGGKVIRSCLPLSSRYSNLKGHSVKTLYGANQKNLYSRWASSKGKYALLWVIWEIRNLRQDPQRVNADPQSLLPSPRTKGQTDWASWVWKDISETNWREKMVEGKTSHRLIYTRRDPAHPQYFVNKIPEKNSLPLKHLKFWNLLPYDIGLQLNKYP